MKDFFAAYPYTKDEKDLLKASLQRTLAKHGKEETLRFYPHYAEYINSIA